MIPDRPRLDPRTDHPGADCAATERVNAPCDRPSGRRLRAPLAISSAVVDAPRASSGAAFLASDSSLLTAGQRCVRHDGETQGLTFRCELLRFAERIRPLLHTLAIALIRNDRTHKIAVSGSGGAGR
jgi:hypothetical protein